MEEPVTTQLKDGAIAVPKEVLAEAGLQEGDDLYVAVDKHGALIMEHTRLFESGEAFLEHLRKEQEELGAKVEPWPRRASTRPQ
jgi:bifunctional DNA-binding transcriptional regulator/antitoxin component of YhaV-PrlF toxin-antitoxin module